GAGRTRTGAIVVAVALSTAAVCVAGPITFVSLTAPQIAKRLARSPGANIVVSALTGALLLVLADLVVQHLPVLVDLPVGVVTAGLGGIYLGYLLVREWTRGRM
ncbi:MAG: iron chelate uptake ABC transporter family permease subunit, partial [Streptosporangiales bacterium]